MKFDNATTALEWWWDRLQAGGVSLENRTRVQEEYEYFEQIQCSRRRWLPHDELCTYVDIGKTLNRLRARDLNIVKSYLIEVVGTHNQDEKRTPYFSWHFRGQWPWVKRRFWRLLPGEYKYGSKRKRRQTPNSKRGSVVSQG